MSDSDRFGVSPQSGKVVQLRPGNARGNNTSPGARQVAVMATSLATFASHCGQSAPSTVATTTSQERALPWEIQKLHAVLKREQMSRFFTAVNDQNVSLHNLMMLAEGQMIFGRRDHARCEHLLHLALVLRFRIQAHYEAVRAGRKQTSMDDSDANLDRLMAQQVVNLMLQAATNSPDESAYSKAWRNQLQIYAADLSQASEADLNNTATFPYHQHPSMLTGKFHFASNLAQGQVLTELRDRYGFNLLRPRGRIKTLVAFAKEAAQFAIVTPESVIRYIDVLGVVGFDGQLPAKNGSASVNNEPQPAVSFDQERGSSSTMVYHMVPMRYVMGG